jgi:hypothetical protein
MSSAALAEAPDFAEALESSRTWSVVATDEGYRLGSVVMPSVWPPGEPLVAQCLRASPAGWLRRRRVREHVAPDAPCACGIYAAPIPLLRQYMHDPLANGTVGLVLGDVSLWGTVVECERGFRASHAYPLRLYLPTASTLKPGHRWDEVMAGLEVYGVPIEPLETSCKGAILLLKQRRLTRK